MQEGVDINGGECNGHCIRRRERARTYFKRKAYVCWLVIKGGYMDWTG